MMINYYSVPLCPQPLNELSTWQHELIKSNQSQHQNAAKFTRFSQFSGGRTMVAESPQGRTTF